MSYHDMSSCDTQAINNTGGAVLQSRVRPGQVQLVGSGLKGGFYRKIVFVAVTHAAEFSAGSPVFRLRSKRGKLLLESSSRRR